MSSRKRSGTIVTREHIKLGLLKSPLYVSISVLDFSWRLSKHTVGDSEITPVIGCALDMWGVCGIPEGGGDRCIWGTGGRAYACPAELLLAKVPNGGGFR
jgi:hypothetical protein